jgi:hypothetical protein
MVTSNDKEHYNCSCSCQSAHKFDLRFNINLNKQLNSSQQLNNSTNNSSQQLNKQQFSTTQQLNNYLPIMINTVIETYQAYYDDPATVRSDDAWTRGITDEMSIIPEDGPAKFSAGTIKGKPAFEDGVLESLGMAPFKTWRRLGGTMVAQSKNWTAIIPGGFRGGETPNKMNPISFEIGEYSALMGLIHVIAIPNQRLTNCVAIMDEDVPLIMEGIQLLDTAFTLLAEGGADEIGSVRWQLSQSGSIKMKDGSEKSAQVTEDDFTENCKHNFRALSGAPSGAGDETVTQLTSKMKMEVTCHADSVSSIRKLHLHGFSSDYKTVAWEKMEIKAEEEHHQVKNTPIEQVIYMANSGKAQQMRDIALSDSVRQPEPEPEPEPELSRQSSHMLSRQSSHMLSRQSSRAAGPSGGNEIGFNDKDDY